MNRGRVVAYLLQQQGAVQPVAPPMDVSAAGDDAGAPRVAKIGTPSAVRRTGRFFFAIGVGVLVLLVGWGCATMPPNRPPEDPFAANQPVPNPQQRGRPMYPPPATTQPPSRGTPPLWRTPPPTAPQYRPPPQAPQRPTPKTFADPPASPPQQRQPAEIDRDLFQEEREVEKEPLDGPTFINPNAGPQASKTSFPDRRKQADAARLVLTVEAPQRRPVGSGAPFQLIVKNPTDAPLRNVQVVCEFDEAFSFPGSPSKSVTHKIPRIDAGDARESLLTLVSDTPGRHQCRFIVSIGSQVATRQTVTVEFVNRQLDWQVQGPTERTVGSRAEFNIPLVNISDEELRNVQVQIDLDAALTVREMTRGGKLDERRVTWTIDRLAAKEGLLLQLEVECREETTQACLSAKVSGVGIPVDDTQVCLTVKPVTGSLDVQLQDLTDPIAVGETVEFVATVSNRGLQTVNGVVLNCTWPEAFEFVRVEARDGIRALKISANVNGRTATVSPAPPLYADHSFQYRLTLKASRVGSHQVTVSAAGPDEPAVEVSEPIMVHR